jgi:adenine-specific DNA-methyltransferase
VNNGKAKLELTWVGKDERPRLEPRILVKDPKLSYGDPNAENMLIQGDNLLALKALEQDFAGMVKCIYIDPPYNTGSAFTHYDDGLEHSIWLSLIRDRLTILWTLLRKDGSLWISIDDDEGAYLRVLLDELFGRDKFVATNVWQKRYSRENREAIGDVHEYILVYAKDPGLFKELRNKVTPTGKQTAVYRNPNNDPKGRWRPIPMTAQEGHATAEQFYEIVAPGGAVHKPPKGRCWGLSRNTFEELRAKGRIYFGKSGNSQPNVIRYLSEVEGIVPWTWWPHEEVGHTDEAKKEIHELFGKTDAFDTPKPERLMQRVIEIASNPGDLILDSFAGSGTTGAVAQKMSRRWIMVEIAEHCRTHIIPRLQKVIDGSDRGGITESVGWDGGGGFTFYRLAESLLVRDKELSSGKKHVYVVNPKYDFTMLIRAICKIENYRYRKNHLWHGISSEHHFLYVTTHLLDQKQLNTLCKELSEDDALLVYCTRKVSELKVPENIEIKKIPRDLLAKCTFEEDRL